MNPEGTKFLDFSVAEQDPLKCLYMLTVVTHSINIILTFLIMHFGFALWIGHSANQTSYCVSYW